MIRFRDFIKLDLEQLAALRMRPSSNKVEPIRPSTDRAIDGATVE